jgi:hypothetical protein
MCLAISNNDEEKAKRIWVISTQLLEKVAKFSEKCSNFGLIDNSLMMCDPQISMALRVIADYLDVVRVSQETMKMEFQEKAHGRRVTDDKASEVH